jgi:hypothetical protein
MKKKRSRLESKKHQAFFQFAENYYFFFFCAALKLRLSYLTGSGGKGYILSSAK